MIRTTIAIVLSVITLGAAAPVASASYGTGSVPASYGTGSYGTGSYGKASARRARHARHVVRLFSYGTG